VITKVRINICTILEVYGVMAAWNLEWRIKTIKINGRIVIIVILNKFKT